MYFDFQKQPGLMRDNSAGQRMTDSPLISIITPFYNAGAYFEQTYNCVLNQTFPWFEWIIVDDGSTQKQDLEILEYLTVQDDRIKLYHIENSGPAAARNYAAAQSRTEFLMPLDADDLIEPTYLEQAFFALYFHPEAQWAYTDSLGFQGMEYTWRVRFDSEKLKKRNYLVNTGMIRKDAFLAVGGYDDAQKYSHEDWNMWLKLLAKGGYPVHIASFSAWYRIHEYGALHQTNDHKEVLDRALNRIQEIARQIKQPVSAIEYPIKIQEQEVVLPRRTEWNRKKTEDKTEILMLVSDIKRKKSVYKILKTLNGHEFHCGVMSTGFKQGSMKWQWEKYSKDIFELNTFLDYKDYCAFMAYYIISRNVKILILENSLYGYYMIPWLKVWFPNITVIDCGENHRFGIDKTIFQMVWRYIDFNMTREEIRNPEKSIRYVLASQKNKKEVLCVELLDKDRKIYRKMVIHENRIYALRRKSHDSDSKWAERERMINNTLTEIKNI
jgi:glycosyltransferase involved in cell wall biosynthesis